MNIDEVNRPGWYKVEYSENGNEPLLLHGHLVYEVRGEHTERILFDKNHTVILHQIKFKDSEWVDIELPIDSPPQEATE